MSAKNYVISGILCFASGVGLDVAPIALICYYYHIGSIGTVSAISAGILEQSMWARNQVGIGLSYRPATGYIGWRIHSLESIPVLLKC